MSKSRIFLKTSVIVKLTILFSTLVTCFARWSISSEASTQKPIAEAIPLAIKPDLKNNRTAEELARIAQLVHQEVNEYRASKDLAPLKFNTLISEQARIHSENMAQQTVKFGHGGFSDRVQALKKSISYGGVAENVAYNMGYKDPVDRAVTGWIESNGHRQNMVGNYNLTGVGVATNPQGEYYFTQIFILEN